jgi:MFS family permease
LEATDMDPGGESAPGGSVDADRCPTGIAIGVGAAVLIGVAVLAATLPPAPPPRLALMTGAVAVFAGVSGDGPAALAVAGMAWPIGNGFLLNRLGVLTWHGRVDVWFVLGLVTAVAVGMLIAQIRLELRGRRALRPSTGLLRDVRGNRTRRASAGRASRRRRNLGGPLRRLRRAARRAPQRLPGGGPATSASRRATGSGAPS